MSVWATTSLLTAPAALAALLWGLSRLRLRQPPGGPARTLQLGAPVTDPAAKLAIAHQQGWVAIVFALALVIGPLVAGAR